MKRKLLSVMLSIAMAVTMISITTTNIYAQDFTGWTVLTDGGTLNAGNYYLQSDVTLTNNIVISGGDVTLDLNGNVLKCNGNGSVITVNGGNLTIQDSNPNKAHTEDFASLPTGGCITGGKGTQVSSEFLGGGVYVAAGGTLVMNGGTIAGCSATKGGGVFTWGSFTMNNNCAIRDCTATVDGGGVCACDCSFIMNNNSIVSNCKANRGAGGVYIFGNPNVSSSFTMNDNSTINECEANTTLSDRCGGGVCVEGNKCSFIMNSGFITNNSAKNGGGVNVFSGTFTMNSGSINNNTVTSHGGAIAVGSGATANIVDGTIENNKATESGGAVQVDGNFTMTGGTIKNNSAIKDGGGLSVNGTIGIATLYGTTEIINNTANIKGGGVSYYGDNSGKVVLGGKVKIVGNVENGTINEGTLTGGTANNVYLYSNNLCITIGTDTYAPTDGMLVGITTYTPPTGTPVKFTTNGTDSDVQHFFSDNGNYKISFNSGTVASGDEYLELKVITIADILATVDGGFPESQETSWKNNTNKNAISFVYPTLSALYFTDSIKAAGEIVINNVEKEGNNYKFVDSSIGTITFNMTNNKLTSLTFEHSTSASMDYSSLDGTYATVVEYEITDGNKTIINIDKSEDVLFTSTADYNKFYNPDSGIIGKVLVDNELVEPTNYVSAEGSTKVTLKASYLSTLSVGQHTIDIISTDGHASTTFTITKNNPSPNPRYDIPNTGVDGTYSNNHSLLKLSSLSLLVIGTYMVIKKKKNN